MIVSPWGEVLAELRGAKNLDGKNIGGRDILEIAMADIDFAYIEKVRREMPLLRRTDVYLKIE